VLIGGGGGGEGGGGKDDDDDDDDSIPNATQMIKAAAKHVKITSFPLPIYSTLKFTYVIKYDRRPHSDTDRMK
jgi:hypothetical protein